jgi:hypothetical protein
MVAAQLQPDRGKGPTPRLHLVAALTFARTALLLAHGRPWPGTADLPEQV